MKVRLCVLSRKDFGAGAGAECALHGEVRDGGSVTLSAGITAIMGESARGRRKKGRVKSKPHSCVLPPLLPHSDHILRFQVFPEFQALVLFNIHRHFLNLLLSDKSTL